MFRTGTIKRVAAPVSARWQLPWWWRARVRPNADSTATGRLVMHIGRSKCASTTIQTILATQRDALRARGWHPTLFGTHYATARSNGAAPADAAENHLELSELLRQDARRRVLSDEWLFTAAETDIASMAEWLRPFEVRIMVYLRPYEDWLVSDYKEQVRSGMTNLDFDRFAAENDHRISALPCLYAWARHFGWRNLRVRTLEASGLEGGTVGADVWAALGCAGPAPAGTVAANRSPDWMAIELIRSLVTAPAPAGWDHGRWMRGQRITEAVQAALAARGVAAPAAQYPGAQYPAAQYPAAPLLRALRTRYTADLRRLARETGVALPAPPRKPLTQRGFLPSAAAVPDAVLADEGVRAALAAAIGHDASQVRAA